MQHTLLAGDIDDRLSYPFRITNFKIARWALIGHIGNDKNCPSNFFLNASN